MLFEIPPRMIRVQDVTPDAVLLERMRAFLSRSRRAVAAQLAEYRRLALKAKLDWIAGTVQANLRSTTTEGSPDPKILVLCYNVEGVSRAVYVRLEAAGVVGHPSRPSRRKIPFLRAAFCGQCSIQEQLHAGDLVVSRILHWVDDVTTVFQRRWLHLELNSSIFMADASPSFVCSLQSLPFLQRKVETIIKVWTSTLRRLFGQRRFGFGPTRPMVPAPAVLSRRTPRRQ